MKWRGGVKWRGREVEGKKERRETSCQPSPAAWHAPQTSLLSLPPAACLPPEQPHTGGPEGRSHPQSHQRHGPPLHGIAGRREGGMDGWREGGIKKGRVRG